MYLYNSPKGDKAAAADIPAFNAYLQKVSSFMKKGKSYSDIAVYLPLEDSWIAGELPVEKQFIWAWGEYEQRYTVFPNELKGYRPIWINSEFLQKAKYENGHLQVGDLSVKALYLDVKYLDIAALQRVLELAKEGLQVCLKNVPAEPGFIKFGYLYSDLIKELTRIPNVKQIWEEMDNIQPFITGTQSFDYWCRIDNTDLYVFFANPKSQNLKFPLEYGQSISDSEEIRAITIHYVDKIIPLQLQFKPYQAVLIKIDKQGKANFIDIEYIPKTPVFKPRIKTGKEKWEVQSPAR